MYAILIDPDNETINNVECDATLEGIKLKLKCKYITVVRISNAPEHHMYCDDEGLINGEHQKGFRSNLYGGVIAGNALIFGSNGIGGEIDCVIVPESIKCKWVDL